VSSWLQEHLDTFVIPRLVISETGYASVGRRIKSEHMSVIKNAWRSAKRAADGKKILLMGRDVWVFEVLARRENYPTVFDPSCSRQTCYHARFTVYNKREHILLDTGFAGTIARAMNVDCILLSANRYSTVQDKQIFPRLKGARSLALFLEELPKYWESAVLNNVYIENHEQPIIQNFSDQFEFQRAALLTQEVYTDSSPRFVAKRNPLGASKYMGY